MSAVCRASKMSLVLLLNVFFLNLVEAACVPPDFSSLSAACNGSGQCGELGVQYENYRLQSANFEGRPGYKCLARRCSTGFDELFGEVYLTCGANQKPNDNDQSKEKAPFCKGSFINVFNRSVGEKINLKSTSFDLNYFSDRAEGFLGAYKITVPITNSDLYSEVVDYDIEVKNEVKDIVFNQKIMNQENQVFNFVWNGLNSVGEKTLGALPYVVRVKTNWPLTADLASENTIFVGTLKAILFGLGGWHPDILHFYDFNAEKLYFGDGQVRKVKAEQVSPGLFRIADESSRFVYEFNQFGLHVATRLALKGAPIYQFQYNGYKLIEVNEPFGVWTKFNYDLSGKLSTITNNYDQTFLVSLNGNGYLRSLTFGNEVYRMTYSSKGLLATFRKPNAAINTFEYDSEGYLIKDSHSGGFYSEIIKTANEVTLQSRMGRRITFESLGPGQQKIKSPNGSVKDISFTAQSYSASEASRSKTMSGIADPRWPMSAWLKTYEQDSTPSYNKVISAEHDLIFSVPTDPFSLSSWVVTEKLGTIDSTLTFDGVNNRFISQTAAGRTSRLDIDEYERPILQKTGDLAEQIITYTGQFLTQINFGLRTTGMTYNAKGLLESITNSLNQKTSYSYDDNERLSQVTLPNNRKINYLYDSVGRLRRVTPPSQPAHNFIYGPTELVSEYRPPLAGLPESSTFYNYNLDNQLSQITRPDGTTIQFEYNMSTGLLSSKIAGPNLYNFSYNLNGLVATSSRNNVSNSFLYNADEIKELSLLANQSPVGTVKKSFNTQYGDIASETVSDAIGQSLNVDFTYDEDRVVKGIGELNINYRMPSGLIETTRFRQFVDTFTFNEYGELLLYESKYKGLKVYSLSLTRDQLGRVVQKREFIYNRGQTNVRYIYDSVGRLRETRSGGATQSAYTYDGNGNRLSYLKNGLTINSTYDDQDRLLSSGSFDYSYNANGELIAKTNRITSESIQYTYDFDGYLQAVLLSGGDSVEYELNAAQQNVGRIFNSNLQKRYLYSDKAQLVAELNNQNHLSRRYVYGTKMNVPDYFVDMQNEGYKIISDHLGSVRLVIRDSDGSVLQSMEHDEFGRLVLDTNPGYTPFGFAGGLHDPDTQIVRFGARDYDPETGRWTSKDPILFDGGDPNLYGYVLNDPVNLIDMNGKNPVVAIGAIAGAGAISGLISGVSSFRQGGSRQQIISAISTGAASGAVGALGLMSGAGGAVAIGLGFGTNVLLNVDMFDRQDMGDYIKGLGEFCK